MCQNALLKCWSIQLHIFYVITQLMTILWKQQNHTTNQALNGDHNAANVTPNTTLSYSKHNWLLHFYPLCLLRMHTSPQEKKVDENVTYLLRVQPAGQIIYSLMIKMTWQEQGKIL